MRLRPVSIVALLAAGLLAGLAFGAPVAIVAVVALVCAVLWLAASLRAPRGAAPDAARAASADAAAARDDSWSGFAELPFGLVMIDAEGRIQWFNHAAADILRLRAPGDFMAPAVSLLRWPALVGALAGPPRPHVLDISTPGERLLRINMAPRAAGGWVLAVRDLTKRRRAELARKSLIGNLAHELRSPLTVIAGYAETLEQTADAATRPAVAAIREQSNRISELVDGMVELERAETLALSDKEVSKTPLDALARRVIADGRWEQEQGSRFELNLGRVAILGSPRDLYSVLFNLIDNAVRHSDPGQPIRVFWDGALCVADRGAGVAPAHLPHLTERFYRADRGRAAGEGGSGLGLAIVKHVMQRHGGALEIESRPGDGSVFRCRFPPSRVTDAAPAEGEEPGRAAEQEAGQRPDDSPGHASENSPDKPPQDPQSGA